MMTTLRFYSLLGALFLVLLPIITGAEEKGSASVTTLQDTWRKAQEFLAQGDLSHAAENIHLVNQLRKESGIRNLEEYSHVLLQRAEVLRGSSSADEVAFYLREAQALSPTSSAIAQEMLPIIDRSGVGSLWKALSHLAGVSIGDPVTWISLLSKFTYPFLWALTFAGCSVLGILSLRFLKEGTGALGKALPRSTRAWLSPVLYVVLFTSALPLGPLWTLLLWSTLGGLLLPYRRKIYFLGGSLCILWASVIPLRENLTYWLHDEGVQALIRVSRGEIQGSDRSRLIQLAARRPGDALVHLVLAQYLWQVGRIDEASEALTRAEHLAPRDSAVNIEKATLLALHHKTDEAREVLEHVLSEGNRSPAVLFNLSKLQFDSLDTEKSRALLTEARSIDPEFIELLEIREEKEGSAVYAPQSLSFFRVLRESLKPMTDLRPNYEKILRWCGPGLSFFVLSSWGILLLVGAAFFSSKTYAKSPLWCASWKLPSAVKRVLQFIPGQGWAEEGSVGQAVIGLASCLFVIMPLLGWPKEVGEFLLFIPSWNLLYLIIVLLYGLIILYFGSQEGEEQ